MKNLLIIYNRRAGSVLELRVFDQSEREECLRQRFRIEMEKRHEPDIEVVTLSARSLDELKKTHSRYFNTLLELTRRGVSRKEGGK